MAAAAESSGGMYPSVQRGDRWHCGGAELPNRQGDAEHLNSNAALHSCAQSRSFYQDASPMRVKVMFALRCLLLFSLSLVCAPPVHAQDARALEAKVRELRAKLDGIKKKSFRLAPACPTGNLRLQPLRGDGAAQPSARCVPPDEAATKYKEACDDGAARACSNLGYLYTRGRGVGPDVKLATNLFQQSCKGGSAIGCSNLAVSFERGAGVIRDPMRALDMYEKSCQRGYAPACVDFGELMSRLRNGSLNMGISGAMLGLGLQGLPVTPFFQQAADTFWKSCDQGDADACSRLGTLIENEEVTADPVFAVDVFLKACSGGIADGCAQLASAYDADSVAKHLPTAHKLYVLACNGGSGRGCARLARMSRDEGGKPGDLSSTARYLTKACDLDDAEGCFDLAGLLSTGQGVPQDLVAAAGLLDRSCDLGSDRACTLRTTGRVLGRMTGNAGAANPGPSGPAAQSTAPGAGSGAPGPGPAPAPASAGDRPGSADAHGGSPDAPPSHQPHVPAGPPNRVGDRCRDAPTNACYAPMSGSWDCRYYDVARPNVIYLLKLSFDDNGYFRATDDPVYRKTTAGCMDCSGAYTALADGDKMNTPRGTFTVDHGGSAATMDWVYCLGANLEACAAAPQGTAHATCERVRSP